MPPRKLDHDAYTVGWVCAVDRELNAARALLDEKDENLEPFHRTGVFPTQMENVVRRCKF
ncbi:hypothetical protein N7471_012781 [Penicillium samsonianum]|uniref:uncharacterized protein n=1 Tax=Penicillium samsonianum TaxID=1882272 RepID=UPI0025492A2B|nr:uncharacterized protein N7471_012781 [Penicillium samsonianum]KAJ6125464.1 hypothetical protein N7471_012781 [Penicillium samsonianum]